VLMEVQVFWNMTPYRRVSMYFSSWSFPTSKTSKKLHSAGIWS